MSQILIIRKYRLHFPNFSSTCTDQSLTYFASWIFQQNIRRNFMQYLIFSPVGNIHFFGKLQICFWQRNDTNIGRSLCTIYSCKLNGKMNFHRNPFLKPLLVMVTYYAVQSIVGDVFRSNHLNNSGHSSKFSISNIQTQV